MKYLTNFNPLHDATWIHFVGGMVCWYNYIKKKPILQFNAHPIPYNPHSPPQDFSLSLTEGNEYLDLSDFWYEFDKERKLRGIKYQYELTYANLLRHN